MKLRFYIKGERGACESLAGVVLGGEVKSPKVTVYSFGQYEADSLCFFLKKKTRDQFMFIWGLVQGYGPLDLEPTL